MLQKTKKNLKFLDVYDYVQETRNYLRCRHPGPGFNIFVIKTKMHLSAATAAAVALCNECNEIIYCPIDRAAVFHPLSFN